VKLQKMMWMVFQSKFDWGSRRVERKEGQSLRGLGTFVETVAPGLRPELASLDRALGGNQESLWIEPGGDEEEVTACWENLWYSIESARVLIYDAEQWEHRFSGPLAGVLRPEQRAALPNESGKTSWVGGDATPQISANMDFRDRVFSREPMQEGLYQALRALLPDQPEEVIIGVAELLTYVITACVRGHLWTHRTNWVVTDKSNTRNWLKTRYSKIAGVQFILRVLGQAEVLHSFESYAAYIRTYHNLLPDGLTREIWEEVVSDLQGKGWVEVKVGDGWK
jgi:hypothetical protein